MLAASYYEGRISGAVVRTVVLEEIENGRRQLREVIKVEGKREARKVAAAKNAKPWNF